MLPPMRADPFPAAVARQALGFPVALPAVPSSPRDVKVGDSAVEVPEPFQTTLRGMWSARSKTKQRLNHSKTAMSTNSED